MKEEEKKKADKKGAEELPPTGYIHVRARRGQATDSHSLAERVQHTNNLELSGPFFFYGNSWKPHFKYLHAIFSL